MLRKIARMVAVLVLVSAVTGVAALELWYRSLLPQDLPQPSSTAVPPFLRKAIWLAEFAGEGQPQVRPEYPFLLGLFLGRDRARLSLPAGVARLYLPTRGPSHEGHLKWVLREAALATWISRHWTADEVLDSYASTVWMGDGHSGVREGSVYLFGKEVEQLKVEEAALLVATIQSPKALSPSCHPGRAMEARNHVLEQLRAAGVIAADEFAAASAAPLREGRVASGLRILGALTHRMREPTRFGRSPDVIRNTSAAYRASRTDRNFTGWV